MRSLRDLSIKQKLFWFITLTSVAVVLLTCTAILTYDLVSFRRAMSEELASLAEIVGTSCCSSSILHPR